MRDVDPTLRGVAAGCGVFLLLAGRAVGGEPGWSLERCRAEALAASHALSASAREVDRSAAAAAEARAARLPTLDFGASYLYTSETMSLDLPVFDFLDMPGVRFGDGNAYDLKLQVSAPLFTGGALHHRARAWEAALAASERDLDAETLRLAHEVRRSYYVALGAGKQSEAARVAEGRLRRHVEVIETTLKAGGASEESRVQALARLRQAEQVRVRAEAAASVERINLGRLVGRPGEEIAPSDDFDASLLEAGAASDTAVDARPEIAALTERIVQSDRMAKAARGAYYPALAAQAAYHHAKPGIDAIANEWMQYGNAGLTLSWPLWEWGARGDRVRQARATGRALEERRAELRQ
jgi:multidrug efflux system outer membrane protein